MSLKAELETWSAALKAYDDEDFPKSLNLFERIADTSRILVNIGLIYATIGEHENAVDNFNAATSLDKHLAVGYFQCGVSNFLLGRYELAYKDFDESLVHLRGNQYIDYDQLGLKFKLWSAEVLFNKGLCQIYLRNVDMGMRDLEAARKEKTTDEHNVIDDALAERGENYTVFSIPVGVLYRPSETKLKGVKAKDYMGKAKLVAATEEKDAFTEFVGVKRMEQGLGPAGQLLDRAMRATKEDSPAPEPLRPALSRANTTATMSGRRKNSDDATAAAALPRGRAGSAEDVTTLKRSDTTATLRPSPNGVPVRGLTISRNRGNTDGAIGRRDDGVGGGGSPTRRPTLSNGRASPKRDPVPPPLPSKSPEPVKLGRTTPETEGSDLTRVPSGGEPALIGTALSGTRGVMTEIFEDYLGGPYKSPSPAPTATGARVAAWQSKTIVGAPPNIPPSRAPSQRGAPTARSGSIRRVQSRKRAASTKGTSTYDDDGDESSYVEEIPWEQMKIKIKIHYDDDTRGMALTTQATFDEFADLLTRKFKRQWEELALKFRDSDGSKITLKDDTDWEMAVEVARGDIDSGKTEARMEIWLSDV